MINKKEADNLPLLELSVSPQLKREEYVRLGRDTYEQEYGK